MDRRSRGADRGHGGRPIGWPVEALPLAVLLKMTMVFPDRAPKRLAVVRKSGNTRNLARRVEEARTQGIEDEPIVAAEKILSLAGALNAHDRLTRGHGERVGS